MLITHRRWHLRKLKSQKALIRNLLFLILPFDFLVECPIRPAEEDSSAPLPPSGAIVSQVPNQGGL